MSLLPNSNSNVFIQLDGEGYSQHSRYWLGYDKNEMENNYMQMQAIRSKSFLLTSLLAAAGFVFIPQARPQTTKPSAPGYAGVAFYPSTIKVGQTAMIYSHASCNIGYGNPIAMIESPNTSQYYPGSYELFHQNGVVFTPTKPGTYYFTSYIQPQSSSCSSLSPNPIAYESIVVTP